ncbi:hypothetical protein DOY81_008019, partial [Sarcophaga bullata]
GGIKSSATLLMEPESFREVGCLSNLIRLRPLLQQYTQSKIKRRRLNKCNIDDGAGAGTGASAGAGAGAGADGDVGSGDDDNNDNTTKASLKPWKIEHHQHFPLLLTRNGCKRQDNSIIISCQLKFCDTRWQHQLKRFIIHQL